MSRIADIAETVRLHRKEAGLSQKELADLAGVGKTAIFDIEKGKESVRLDTLVKVMDALNIKMSFDSPLSRRGNEKS